MSTNLTISGKTIFLTPTGVKLGSKGKVQPTTDLINSMTKGERRKFRKTAYAYGYFTHASAGIRS